MPVCKARVDNFLYCLCLNERRILPFTQDGQKPRAADSRAAVAPGLFHLRHSRDPPRTARLVGRCRWVHTGLGNPASDIAQHAVSKPHLHSFSQSHSTKMCTLQRQCLQRATAAALAVHSKSNSQTQTARTIHWFSGTGVKSCSGIVCGLKWLGCAWSLPVITHEGQVDGAHTSRSCLNMCHTVVAARAALGGGGSAVPGAWLSQCAA